MGFMNHIHFPFKILIADGGKDGYLIEKLHLQNTQKYIRQSILGC